MCLWSVGKSSSMSMHLGVLVSLNNSPHLGFQQPYCQDLLWLQKPHFDFGH